MIGNKKAGLIAIVLALLCIQGVSASWYAGSNLQNVYGAWAYILTPSTPPNLVEAPLSGVSNWVSTPGPNWIQAGWRYYHWYDEPRQYVESCINTCTQKNDYFIDTGFATQSWDTTVDYMIESIEGTTNRWCAYTAGVQRHCRNVRSAPSDIQVKSEVHASSLNPLNITFSPVRYKDSSQKWKLFSNNTFRSNFPYDVQVNTNYNFRTYRVKTEEIYLPLLSK